MLTYPFYFTLKGLSDSLIPDWLFFLTHFVQCRCCPGLAIVISPLLSLIQDQVQSMTKLGVESVFLNSAQDYESEQRQITHRLRNTSEHSGIKLLYLTPEKLRHSQMIQGILRQLYQRNLLSRFVIDEGKSTSNVLDYCNS